MTVVDIHSPERWRADLQAAGWKALRHDVWQAPNGALFRGPYGAWCALQTLQVDSCEGCGTTEGVRFRPDADGDFCDGCYEAIP